MKKKQIQSVAYSYIVCTKHVTKLLIATAGAAVNVPDSLSETHIMNKQPQHTEKAAHLEAKAQVGLKSSFKQIQSCSLNSCH